MESPGSSTEFRYVPTAESHGSVKTLGEEFTSSSHASAASPEDTRMTKDDSTNSLSMFDFSVPFSRSNSATVPLITAACSPPPLASQTSSKVHTARHNTIQGLISRTQNFALRRAYIPTALKDESMKLLDLTWPIVVTQLLQFCLQLTGAVFCGHVGKIYLDAVAMGNMVLNTAGMSVLIGLGCACDTLFPQIFGSENKKKMGVIFQRSVLILLLSCLPCWALLINAENLLTAIGQDQTVSKLASQFVKAALPVLPGEAIQLVCTKYLQSQRILIPSMVIFFLVNLINLGLHALLIFGFNLGVFGSGISLSISYWLLVVLHVLFIKLSHLYEETWEGLSSNCLQNWGQFSKLAVPGLLMVCLQWWCFEILTFLAGLLSIEELAAHSIVYHLTAFLYMVPLGLCVAVGISVGNYLGSGNTTSARNSAKAALALAVFWSVGVGLVVIAIKDVFPYVFTNDRAVISQASSIIPIMCLLQIGDAIQCVGSGVVFGCGRQGLGAIIHLVTYYCVATPISSMLMFLTPLRILGSWWGLVTCTTCQAVTFTLIVFYTDWVKVTSQAQVRCQLDEMYINNGQERGSGALGNNDQIESGVMTTVDSQQNVNNDNISDHAQDFSCDNVHTDVVDGRSHLLTTKQLIVRRLSALAACLLLLAIGIVLHISLQTPSAQSASCILVSGSEVNETGLSFQIHHRESFKKMSAEDQRILNLTFWYEMTHHWNKTFLYCGDTIQEPDSSIRSTTYNLTKLYSHLSVVSRPSG